MIAAKYKKYASQSQVYKTVKEKNADLDGEITLKKLDGIPMLSFICRSKSRV
jgi:hypothetical protein